MGAGRPSGSKTPVWRNEAAIKVVVYRFLMIYKKQEATKSGCVKYMKVSRNTATKWWDVVRWTPEDLGNLRTVRLEWDDDMNQENNVKRFQEEYHFETEYIRILIEVLDMLYYSRYAKYWNVQF